jgi:hypothetical protein
VGSFCSELFDRDVLGKKSRLSGVFGHELS